MWSEFRVGASAQRVFLCALLVAAALLAWSSLSPAAAQAATVSFEQSLYEFDTRESQSSGVLGHLSATASSGLPIAYRIEPPADEGPLGVFKDGRVYLQGDLDYESTPTHTFTARASLSTDEAVFGLTVVVVRVADVDEPPRPVGRLGVDSLTGTTVALSWQVPDDTHRPPTSGYDVDYRPVGGAEWSNAATATVATSLLVTGLSAGAEYLFRVTAINDEGRTSATIRERTADAGITFPSKIERAVLESATEGTALSPAIDAHHPTGETLEYALTGEDAAGFAIDPASGLITVGTDGLDFEAKQTHHLTVTATESGGGTASAPVRIRVLDVDEPPGPLQIVQQSVGVTWVRYGWSGSDDDGIPPVTQHEMMVVERGESYPPTAYYDMGCVPATFNAATAVGLGGTRELEVRIRAISHEGSGPWSTEEFTLLEPEPDSPDWHLTSAGEGMLVGDLASCDFIEGPPADGQPSRRQGSRALARSIFDGIEPQLTIHVLNDADSVFRPGQSALISVDLEVVIPAQPVTTARGEEFDLIHATRYPVVPLDGDASWVRVSGGLHFVADPQIGIVGRLNRPYDCSHFVFGAPGRDQRWWCPTELELQIPPGTPHGDYTLSAQLTLGRRIIPAWGYVVVFADDGGTHAAPHVHFPLRDVYSAETVISVGQIQELASIALALADDAPDTIGLEAETELTLSVLNENGLGSDPDFIDTILLSTTSGALSVDGTSCAGQLACQLTGAELAGRDLADLTVTYQAGDSAGDVQIRALVVGEGDTFETDPVTVTVSGEAAGLEIEAPASSILNASTDADDRDLLKLAISASDDSGHGVPVPTTRRRATVVGPDGERSPAGIRADVVATNRSVRRRDPAARGDQRRRRGSDRQRHVQRGSPRRRARGHADVQRRRRCRRGGGVGRRQHAGRHTDRHDHRHAARRGGRARRRRHARVLVGRRGQGRDRVGRAARRRQV